MAITTDDFNKIWASASPLTPYSFSKSQYKEGWNFIGSTPPSRQMWDFLQKNNDEKMQYLLNNFDNYLPLRGGTMSGTITITANPGLKVRGNDSYLVLCGASSYDQGAHMLLNGKNRRYNEGTFGIVANDGSGGHVVLTGKPDGTLTWDGQPLLPIGVVQAFAGTTIPNGWLLCDGSAVSRTTYANLFACIGTTYGSGDGSTTFNLPNLIDKFIEGSATAGTEHSAGLPNITGKFKVAGCTGGIDDLDGAFYSYLGGLAYPADHGGEGGNIAGFDASRSSSVYGNSTTVQPPALTMRYIIKY